MKQNKQARKISLTDICTIIKETVVDSAPALIAIGEALEQSGRDTEIAPVQIVGSAVETIARLSLRVADMLQHDEIKIVDTNGSRGIQDQLLAMQTYKKVKAGLPPIKTTGKEA